MECTLRSALSGVYSLEYTLSGVYSQECTHFWSVLSNRLGCMTKISLLFQEDAQNVTEREIIELETYLYTEQTTHSNGRPYIFAFECLI